MAEIDEIERAHDRWKNWFFVLLLVGLTLSWLPDGRLGAWGTAGDWLATLACVAYVAAVGVSVVRSVKRRDWPAVVGEVGYWLVGVPVVLVIFGTSWWAPVRLLAAFGWLLVVLVASSAAAILVRTVLEERAKHP